ncbi:hypothetical protein PG623_09920 [Riemerella anatipestifer]|uniref:hypothetical protein n=1 Tax=Riemerella anatipestifer TaxID=34085 RepID=UPI001374C187|nr:hypothetical protein [Riemerella anatipestifer]MDY3364309.1 hypothetical protein [Riemerella anatipestifer]
MKYKYAIIVNTHFHIEQFLSNNNITNNTSFWQEGSDEDGDRTLYFSSVLLNDLNEVQEIYDKANEILSIYIGIYRLLDRNKILKDYFLLDRLIDIEQNKVIDLGKRSDLFKISLDFSNIEKRTDVNHPIYRLFEDIIEVEFLKNLFFILSKNVDYRMLYIIYDDIRFFLKEIGDKNFLEEYKSNLNDFTHTANNFEVLGFYARHGRTNNQPPKKPMTLENSMNLIFDIIVRLLDEKFNIKCPKYWGLMYFKEENL